MKNSKTLKNTKRVIIDTFHQIQEVQLPQVASSLAFTTILSIIPLLAISFSVFKAFGGLEKLYGAIEPFVITHLTEGASEEAIAAIRKFIGNIHAATLGVTGLFGLIFTSMVMLSSAEKAINRVWKTTLTRPLLQRISLYWLFITLGPIALSVALGAATSADFPVTRLLPSGVMIPFISTGLFTAIYKWVPHRKVNWRPACAAALFTVFFTSLARTAFSLYTRKMVSYDKIYGSLEAIPILLLWIYIVWLIVLSGAALSAALQRRLDHP